MKTGMFEVAGLTDALCRREEDDLRGRPLLVDRKPGGWQILILLSFLLVLMFVDITSALGAQPFPQLLRSPENVAKLSAQLEMLAQEKTTRSNVERKIDSQLLYAIKRARNDVFLDRVPSLRTELPSSGDGSVLVDIKAVVSPSLLDLITREGGRVINNFPKYHAIRAELPIGVLETVAAETAVTSIRPADLGYSNKLDTSEGDIAHAADLARGAYSVNGSGVKVGVLSDSVDALASLQSSGDLPAVTVLPGQSGVPGTSEGTAMLEIVYDLAPGADLLFATAYGGEAAFAQNILELRAAGSDVIVDDIGYFFEPVFQDGIVAQAVTSVTNAGALYFSSAGNSGNLNGGESGVWEGDYESGPSVFPDWESMHIFQLPNVVENGIIADSGYWIVLQWSDAFGASYNDYDLFILDSALNIYCASTELQDGDDDPLEGCRSGVPGGFTGLYVLILKWTGEDRFLHLTTNRGRLQFGTDGQVSGHAAAEQAFAVAAVDVATAGGGSFVGGSANPVETFSSDGPRRIFYEADGTPLTPGNFLSSGGVLRPKPDIAAADGVSTATPGFAAFYGTSAAAPHVAAIAALAKEADPGIDTVELQSLFGSTALDIEAWGFDRDSGDGIVMADALLEAIGVLCGDADSNGVVNIIDALAVARSDAGLPPPPPVDPAAANVNGDGSVNIIDALMIARFDAGLPTPGTCLAQ